MTQFVIKEKAVEHPLEELFDITPGTTVVEYTEALPAEIVQLPNYDAKDNEIEVKYEEIYTVAMENVETLGDEMQRVEGKYKARMGEVTATMLNVALGAVREKAQLKMHKDKLSPTSGPQTVNNTLNVVTADRNELIKILLDQQQKKNQS